MSASPLPFKNQYRHRRAAGDRACWVCGKPTFEVLTHDDVDFFFVCMNHIQDPGFCTATEGGVPKQYALHARMFALREAKHREKKRQERTQAALAGLPAAPSRLPPKRAG
ncbi:hypothetical protein H9P43_003037 [Blastocladiella emersonii ATCC 22665]|nr:hypothetical protein H9P43_003037 [Blastocladiella emersonii ATCC 22665]